MENTPSIIIFWNLGILLFIFMIVLMIAAIILIKRSKRQGTGLMQFWGSISLVLSILCSIPILLVVGYVLYLFLT